MCNQIEVVRNKFSDDEINFLLKKMDYLILNEKNLCKSKVMECLRNLRDELDRWG